MSAVPGCLLMTATLPKFEAQAIRKVYEIGWRPTHFLNYISASVGLVLRPAGSEKTVGIVTVGFLKEPTDPQWQHTPEYKDWLAWMRKYNSSGDVADVGIVYRYSQA
jgi:branched-chain amino acid transport system substrate-binding protein